MGGTDFLLLGPLEIRPDREPLDLGIPARSNRARLLAVLLRRLGSTVPASKALTWVWDEDRSTDTLIKCVTSLRAALALAGIGLVRVDDAYRLEGVEKEDVDVYRLDRLRSEAKEARAADPQAAMRLLRQAVGLRRGTPLANLDSDYLRGWRAELEDQHRAARRELLRLELDHDGGDDLLPRVLDLHTDEPADLESAALAMAMLYRAGARERALEVYRHTRSVLTSAVTGAPPPTALDPIHEQIVAGTFDPDAWLGDGRPGGTPGETPWHLPPALLTFTGRETEIARLDKALADVQARGAVGIVGIEGEAGVGKTKLAVHWAHQVADRFPDGLLHLDLNGFSTPASRCTGPKASGTSCWVSASPLPRCRQARPNDSTPSAPRRSACAC